MYFVFMSKYHNEMYSIFFSTFKVSWDIKADSEGTRHLNEWEFPNEALGWVKKGTR